MKDEIDDSKVGLRDKYAVTNLDNGHIVEDCFVLRPDRDRAAVLALVTYAQHTENRALSGNILDWLVGMGAISLAFAKQERSITPLGPYQILSENLEEGGWDFETDKGGKVWSSSSLRDSLDRITELLDEYPKDGLKLIQEVPIKLRLEVDRGQR